MSQRKIQQVVLDRVDQRGNGNLQDFNEGQLFTKKLEIGTDAPSFYEYDQIAGNEFGQLERVREGER